MPIVLPILIDACTVSQIWSFTEVFSLTYTTLDANSTPTVTLYCSENYPLIYRMSMDDFPTPWIDWSLTLLSQNDYLEDYIVVYHWRILADLSLIYKKGTILLTFYRKAEFHKLSVPELKINLFADDSTMISIIDLQNIVLAKTLDFIFVFCRPICCCKLFGASLQDSTINCAHPSILFSVVFH